MNRELMWECYQCVMEALSNHMIDAEHHHPVKPELTTFYFKDCCGGDIVDCALEIFNKRNNKL